MQSGSLWIDPVRTDFNIALGLLLVLTLVACLYLVRALFRAWTANEVADPKKQLSFASAAAFEAKPILNRSEFQLLLVLEGLARDVNAGHRVMAQTCFGEFLRLKRGEKGDEANRAYRSINSKRADFVIVDAAGYPAVVVEYQGSGHYQGTAALRDAVKREACRSAGVAFVEVMPDYRKADLIEEIREILHDERRRA